jgi:hypothetical protein
MFRRALTTSARSALHALRPASRAVHAARYSSRADMSSAAFDPAPAPSGAARVFDPTGINHDDVYFPETASDDRHSEEYIAEAMRQAATLVTPAHVSARIVSTSDAALGFSSAPKKPVRGQMTDEERTRWGELLDRARDASKRGDRAALLAIYAEANVSPPAEPGAAPTAAAAPSVMEIENAMREPMPHGFSMQTPVNPAEGIPEAFLTRELRDLAPLYTRVNELWNRSSRAPMAARVATGRLSQVDLWTALVLLQDNKKTIQYVLDKYKVRVATMGHARGADDDARLQDSSAAMAEFDAFSTSLDAQDMSPFYHQQTQYVPPRHVTMPGPKTVAEAEEIERQEKLAAANAAAGGAPASAASSSSSSSSAYESPAFVPGAQMTAQERARNLADAEYRKTFVARVDEFYTTRLSVFDRLRFLRLVDIFSVHHPVLGRMMRGERIDDDAHALERGLLKTIFHLVRAKELTEAELDFFSGTMRRLMNHASPGSSVPLGDRVFFAPEGIPQSELSKQHQERLRRFGVPDYARSATGSLSSPGGHTAAGGFDGTAPFANGSHASGPGSGVSTADTATAGAQMPGSAYAAAAGVEVAPTPFLVRSLYTGAMCVPLVQAATRDDPAVGEAFDAFPSEVLENTAKYLQVPWLVESAISVQGMVRALHAVTDLETVPADRRGPYERLNFANITRTSDTVAGVTGDGTVLTKEPAGRTRESSNALVDELRSKFKLDLRRAATETMQQVTSWSAATSDRAKEVEEKVFQRMQEARRAETGAGATDRSVDLQTVDEAEAASMAQPDLYGGPRAVKVYLAKLEQLQKERQGK